MAKSMTGYGRGDKIDSKRSFIVEIKSINHKFNDITVKLPRTMLIFEDRINKAISAAASRGKIDVYVNYEAIGENDKILNMNTELIDSYVCQLRQLQARYEINEPITLSMLVNLDGAFAIEPVNLDEEALWETLSNALDTAIANFLKMRSCEGEALKNDILLKVDKIELLVAQIVEKSSTTSKDYFQKLKLRLAELINDASIDENRVITEAAIITDKACIDEETTRLSSHLVQLRAILDETEPIGRKLDFLVQEMMRESNTIASKANNLDITNTAVLLKTEIEKIREQVQNLE